jgi:urease accessory protein
MVVPKAPRRLRLSFARGGRGTALATLHQEAPLRVLFPRPSAGDLLEAVLVNTSGGLVGGDRLETDLALGRGAEVLISSQAAEKAYGSAGPDVRIGITLEASDAAWLEWLPQETILFDRARLRRHTTVHLAPSARLLATDMVVFGRQAHGETLATGLFVDAWRIHRGSRLSWADTLRLEGDLQAPLKAPFGFAGARAIGLLIYAAADAGDWLECVRDRLATTPPHWGATSLPGLLVVRWLSRDPAVLRRQVADLAAALRQAIVGLPPRLPTTWWT